MWAPLKDCGSTVHPRCGIFLFLLVLPLVYLSAPLGSLHTTQQAFKPRKESQLPSSSPFFLSPVAALSACHAARGLGVEHYLSLAGSSGVRRVTGASSQAADASCGTELRHNASVTHCCLLLFRFQGRSGNLLTQYAAGRYFAELNSCAMEGVAFTSGNEPVSVLGSQALDALHLQWPPAQGATFPYAFTLDNPIEAYNYHRVDFGGSLTMSGYPEQANWQYSALSLGWDLAGGTLMGSGMRGLNRQLTAASAVVERSRRWGRHREACAQAGVLLRQLSESTDTAAAAAAAPLALATALEGLHPWLPTAVRQHAQQLLAGTHPQLTPSLAACLAQAERCIVLHVRLDDLYAGSQAAAGARGAQGMQAGSPDWLGGEQPPPAPGEAAAAAAGPPSPRAQLEMLEGSAAGLRNTPAPLSYYQAVLRATRGAWDVALVVGDASLQANPLFHALAGEFNATLQSGSASLDMAVLLLARQLVVAGGSTFSFVAAAQGRARAVHAPHMGLLLTQPWSGASQSCMLTPSALDARWVFHDVFRASVRRVARGLAAQAAQAAQEGLGPASSVSRQWALQASGGVWAEHLEWRVQPLAQPLPQWDSSCPEDAPEGQHGRAGLEFALGSTAAPEDAGGEGSAAPLDSAAPPAAMPLYFLTFQELVRYYRNPACSRYFFVSSGLGRSDPKEPWSTCPDRVSMAPLKEGGFSGRNCRVDGQWAQPCEG